MLAQPGLQGLGAPARQHLDALARLGVDQNRGAASRLGQGEVVNAEHPRYAGRRQGQAQQDAHGGMPRDADGQREKRPRARAPGPLPCDRADPVGQARGTALIALEYAGELLAEGLPDAANVSALQATHGHYEHHSPGIERDIGHNPPLVGVHPVGLGAAVRTGHRPARVLTWTSIHVL
jgi:hypothetical protein